MVLAAAPVNSGHTRLWLQQCIQPRKPPQCVYEGKLSVACRSPEQQTNTLYQDKRLSGNAKGLLSEGRESAGAQLLHDRYHRGHRVSHSNSFIVLRPLCFWLMLLLEHPRFTHQEIRE